MEFLKDRDFKFGFAAGFFLHTLMVWTRTKFFPLPIQCLGDCSRIYYWDIPLSILYYAFDDAKVIFASFLIGSVYWGFLFYGLLVLVKRFFGTPHGPGRPR